MELAKEEGSLGMSSEGGGTVWIHVARKREWQLGMFRLFCFCFPSLSLVPVGLLRFWDDDDDDDDEAQLWPSLVHSLAL